MCQGIMTEQMSEVRVRKTIKMKKKRVRLEMRVKRMFKKKKRRERTLVRMETKVR